MWRSQATLLRTLAVCERSQHTRNIFLIQNGETSESAEPIITGLKKCNPITLKQNIFVNPAWNIGYIASSSEILCIANDDIAITDSALRCAATADWANIDLIGTSAMSTSSLSLKPAAYARGASLGSQYSGFGSCMFLRRDQYRYIPEELKIWFGDDYLVSMAQRVYLMSGGILIENQAATLKLIFDTGIYQQILSEIDFCQSRLGLLTIQNADGLLNWFISHYGNRS